MHDAAPKITSRRILLAACLALLCVPAITFHAFCDVWPEDDAYITYRYVWNAFSGNGLVYNSGERVFGSSSPLYTGLLWLLKQVFRDVDVATLSVRGNAIAYVLCAGLLMVAVRSVTRAWLAAVLAAVFFLLNPFLLEISIGGMESFVFVAFALAALSAGLQGRHSLAYALAGLATLGRPEGVLIAAVLAVMLPWRAADRWRVAVRSGVAYAVVLLIWGVPATLYYGTPIPHSLVAKSQPLYPLETGAALRSMAWMLRSWAVGLWASKLPLLGSLLGLFSVMTIGVGVRRGWGNGNRRPAVAALLVGVLVAFYALSNPMMFPWYWPVLYVPCIALMAVGLHGLWQGSAQSAAGGLFRKGVVLVVAGLALAHPLVRWHELGALPTREGWGIAGTRSLWRDRQPDVVRVVPYWIVGQWLSERYPESPVVASAEIGALGYAYRGKILDVCGLVSPEAIPYLPVPDEQRFAPHAGSASTEMVLELKPDIVVTMQLFIENSLRVSEDFRRQYRLVAECVLPHKLWRSHSIQVFERIGSNLRRVAVALPSEGPLRVWDGDGISIVDGIPDTLAGHASP
jgi:hypothetical protein